MDKGEKEGKRERERNERKKTTEPKKGATWKEDAGEKYVEAGVETRKNKGETEREPDGKVGKRERHRERQRRPRREQGWEGYKEREGKRGKEKERWHAQCGY